MKTNKFIYLVLMLIWIIIQGCSSPMDVDTPRDIKYIEGEDYSITGSISDIRFEENGTVKQFISENAEFRIDTTQNRSLVWLKIEMLDNHLNAKTAQRLCIKSFQLNLEKVDISKPYQFDGRISGSNKAIFRIDRGLNTDNDTLTYSGQDFSSTEMTFNLNRAKGELWAHVITKVYDNKIWLEYRDSSYIDYITVTRLDTTYDQTGKMIVKEIKETIPKEVTVTLEEEKRQRDSLFLNGKFKVKF